MTATWKRIGQQSAKSRPYSHLFTEADWTDPDHKDNVPYTRSKTIAERAAWAELPKLSRPLEWVAINPGLVLGPVLDKDSNACRLAVGSGSNPVIEYRRRSSAKTTSRKT